MIEIRFLPYGRVDAILIVCDGKTAFVDSGYRSNGQTAVQHMRSIGITRLDAYIASHRHRNHVGGAPVIIEQMKPSAIYTADERMKDRLVGLAANKAQRAAIEKTPFRVLDIGESFKVGGAIFTRIGPIKLRKCSAGSLAENYNSLILRGVYCFDAVLLTGDTSSAILAAIAKQRPITAELMKNPHHGGNQTLQVLRAICPDITVLCNSSPCSSAYRKRLGQASCGAVYSACKKGNGYITATSRGVGWSISTTK